MSNFNPIDLSGVKRIGLIDADLLDNGTRFPNLALMKLSGFFKNELNCDVELISEYDSGLTDAYDRIFLSKVFDYTFVDDDLINHPNVISGGSGFNRTDPLPDVIEHCRPDYTLYEQHIKNDMKHKKSYWNNYQNNSIGFATRGCFRKCAFCINRDSQRVRFHSHVSEWLDPASKRIILLDDNILGYHDWESVFEELAKTNKPFQFKQGLDIRMLTDRKAQILNESRYYDRFIFAFDDLKDEALITEKLKMWRKHSNRITALYVLAGFDGTDQSEIESVFKRIEIIGSFGCVPYIMRHKNYLRSPHRDLFTQIARWCNQPQFFKYLSFREFCEKNQALLKTNRLGIAMRSLINFQNDFPEIAMKYFDKKYFKK